MTGSSNTSVRNGDTPPKEPHCLTPKSSADTGSIAARRIGDFMKTKNEGGDPITALSLRPFTSSMASKAARAGEVKRALTEALKKLSGSST
ncbi:hypothetical protein DL766_003560 [Monosporascus sp. MC13-8B]|uniref:Uncharacterized protein n=1 Tax=Monosporascus cannonballus TaxID=155416 RepID=A0ABY0HBD9_9PEZI|nr:hypothetical protein DL763_006795 [Monosporascus cannonballus]RYO87573.1 hypothetical protein DL762_004219 [Monosporascus cannonballus]RYP33255.1 hypothetical protein DL766_003560 [Monosporascus sp. MC13-8B]